MRAYMFNIVNKIKNFVKKIKKFVKPVRYPRKRSFFKEVFFRANAVWRRFFYKHVVTTEKEKELTVKYSYANTPTAVMRMFYVKNKRSGITMCVPACSIREVIDKYGDNYDVKEPMIKS
jgi:hypothetical protein